MGRNKDVSWAHFIFHCLLGRTFWNILLLRKHLEPIVYQVKGGGGWWCRWQIYCKGAKTWIFKTDPNDFKRGLWMLSHSASPVSSHTTFYHIWEGWKGPIWSDGHVSESQVVILTICFGEISLLTMSSSRNWYIPQSKSQVLNVWILETFTSGTYSYFLKIEY